MQNPGYIALSRQTVLLRQLEVTANNIANLNTNAFKRKSVVFGEHLANARNGQSVSYVTDVGSMRDLRQGSLRATGRQMDIGIEGEGYFSIETAGGLRYGRDGQFQLNQERELVTRNNHRLLGEDGEPIQAPEGARDITFQKTGEVLANGEQIGRIQLTRFNNPQALVQTADGLLRADGDGEPDPGSVLHQGMLESSNVNPVTELVAMLEIQRDYQGSHRLIKAENDRMTRAIRELGRVEAA